MRSNRVQGTRSSKWTPILLSVKKLLLGLCFSNFKVWTTIEKLLNCRFRLYNGSIWLNQVFMLKINNFFEKTGVFCKSIEKKSGGPFKNWLYFAPNLLLTRFFWLNRPLLSYLFAFTSKKYWKLTFRGPLSPLFSKFESSIFQNFRFFAKMAFELRSKTTRRIISIKKSICT